MRWLRRILLTLLSILMLAFLFAWLFLAGSRPLLDGSLNRPGISAAAIIQRDHLGVVTIQTANRRDLAYALGFIHAQERFFQMDLLRRAAAGELAELVGSSMLKSDLNHRRHLFRERAQAQVAALPANDRALLDAYRVGVNEGLTSLKVRPWEYLLLRAAPVPWRDEDSLLVVDSMFLTLDTDGTDLRELRFAQMRAALPAAVVNFLLARDGAWEAPLQGEASPPPEIPDPSVFDLRAHVPASAPITIPDALRPGSNNFAVSGALTGGGALVANDMHLGLNVPNIWFRARLRYPDPQTSGQLIDLNGVTLPGMPALIAGSNGHVAWGFTDSYGDWLDWVRIERDPQDVSRYRVPEGWATIESHTETIHVKGAPSHTLNVEETRWGPIMAKDTDGASLALAWIAQLPRTCNLNLLKLERARTVHEALDIAPTTWMPPQNFVAGDEQGHIGWTLSGNALPLRSGFDPAVPANWSQPGTGWIGFADPTQFPRIEDPVSGRLWTANNRTTSGSWLAILGDGGYDNGARAKQIRDDLLAHTHFAAADLLAVQLDDCALFLTRWQQLLQNTLARASDPDLAELRRLTSPWKGHAAVDSVDYRLVQAFRIYVHQAVLAPFVAAMRGRFAEFSLPPMFDGEAPVWALLQSRPQHLLDPKYADWESLLRAAAHRVVDTLGRQPGGLSARTWGERNTESIRHPLSAALPHVIARFLDMPAIPLPGDNHMPRAQGTDFGASERFAIMPGHEESSYLHMPGGQSDNPLSPYYGAGHDDWVRGRPTPLLPGPAEHHLTLNPAISTSLSVKKTP